MDFSHKKEYNRKITFRDPESFSNGNDKFMYRKLNSNLSIIGDDETDGNILNTTVSNTTPIQKLPQEQEQRNYPKTDNLKANQSRTSFTNTIDFSVGEYVIMQSFQDLSKFKYENEDKVCKEIEMQNNQNPNRARRKYACSKKMMLNRLKRNSRDSHIDYSSSKFNVNELSNFSICEGKNKYLNKSFDLINENKLDCEVDAEADNHIDNSFYGYGDNNTATNYFDLKRESSFCSNNALNFNFNNVNLNLNRASNLNCDFNPNFNRISNIENEPNNVLFAEVDKKEVNNKNNPEEKTNKNFNKNNSNNNNNDNNNNNYSNSNVNSHYYNKTSRNNRSKHYEEIRKSENFLEFINYRIENFQKEMMDYLSAVKLDLEKAYKKFYEKVIKISTDKARRITQVYTNESKAGLIFNPQFYKETSSFFFKPQDNAENHPSFSAVNSPVKTQRANQVIGNSDDKDNNFNLNKNQDVFSLLNNKSENLQNNKNTHISGNDTENPNESEKPNKSFTNSKPSNKNFTKQQSFNAFGDQTPFLSKELENLKNFANKYITERIDTMFELHENLKDSIKQNVSLLTNFLNEYDFNCLNPMQEFINANADEICNSWVLPKINFEKLNLNCILKNNKIPKVFRNYLIHEDSENKFNKYTIEKSASYELDKRILRQNSLFLEKLVLQKLNSVGELQKIFCSEEIQILNFDKIRKLRFVKSSLDYLANLNGFKNTYKLEAKKSFFESDIPLNLCEKNFPNLTKIAFSECNLNNASVAILMSEFEKLKNLEEINFSNNDITLFNYRGSAVFSNLHTLILRKNKISKFYLKNKNMYPQLKVVDLCCNNIVDLTQVKELVEENSVMVLISRNLGLYNNPPAHKAYLAGLKAIMLQAENKLRKLDLSYLYYLFSNHEEFHFKNLCLNKILLFNVKRLDLSFNNLYDEDLAEFFKSNRGLVNIKEISLKNNRLTESFFEILIDLELNDLYEYLESFDLASNNINHNCLEALLKAFQDNSNLNQIVLKSNPIENYFYSFFCRRLENKQRNERFIAFFNGLEKLKREKRNCVITLNCNSDLFQYFSNEAKEISSKFIKFEK